MLYKYSAVVINVNIHQPFSKFDPFSERLQAAPAVPLTDSKTRWSGSSNDRRTKGFATKPLFSRGFEGWNQGGCEVKGKSTSSSTTTTTTRALVGIVTLLKQILSKLQTVLYKGNQRHACFFR